MTNSSRSWPCPPSYSPSLASKASWKGVFSPHPPHHHPLSSLGPSLNTTRRVYDTTRHARLRHNTTRPGDDEGGIGHRAHPLKKVRFYSFNTILYPSLTTSTRHTTTAAHQPATRVVTPCHHHTILENEPHMFVFEGGCSLPPPPPLPSSKTSISGSFSRVVGSSLLQSTTTTLENELVHSFSMVSLIFFNTE